MRKFAWPEGKESYYDTPNPSYEPEACGLTLVASMEDPQSSYDFDMALVWRDNESGAFYIGFDSGCSCPTPYENVKGLDDLTVLDSVEQAKSLVLEKNSYDRWPARCVMAFLEEVERALRRGSTALPPGTP